MPDPDRRSDVAALVAVESPSEDPVATAAAAETVDELVLGLLGGGPTKLAIVAHVDTVWPFGTTARWPFDVVDGQATGPGVFDMKAGLVQGLHALSVLPEPDGVVLLVTTDEEIGSPTSRALIEEKARGATAALVLEPSASGALKSARKGFRTTSWWRRARWRTPVWSPSGASTQLWSSPISSWRSAPWPTARSARQSLRPW